MAAVMTGDGTRLVLGESHLVQHSTAAHTRFKVDRLMELRAVIDSLRSEADVETDSHRAATLPAELHRTP